MDDNVDRHGTVCKCHDPANKVKRWRCDRTAGESHLVMDLISQFNDDDSRSKIIKLRHLMNIGACTVAFGGLNPNKHSPQ